MYEEIIKQAEEYSPLVKKAATYIRLRTRRMRADQQIILAKMQGDWDAGTYSDVSDEAFRKQLSAQITEDLACVQSFDAEIGRTSSKYQLRFNKMSGILSATKEVIDSEDDKVVSQLQQGKLPNILGYGTGIPVLGTTDFWGNNDNALITSLLMTMRFSRGETIATYERSSIAHVIPTGINPDYARSRYAYNHNGVTGFGTVGIYAFGGSRTETELPGKEFVPHDGSSWIAELTGAPVAWSTADLLCGYRSLTGKGAIPDEWSTSGWGVPLIPHFETTYSVVPQEDMLAGDLLFSRTFKPEAGDPESNLGAGGNVGIVIDVDPADTGKALVFCFNRDRERQNFEQDPPIYGMDGVGIESRNMYNEGNSRVFFMRPISAG